jgi:hypothetical protein
VALRANRANQNVASPLGSHHQAWWFLPWQNANHDFPPTPRCSEQSCMTFQHQTWSRWASRTRETQVPWDTRHSCPVRSSTSVLVKNKRQQPCRNPYTEPNVTIVTQNIRGTQGSKDPQGNYLGQPPYFLIQPCDEDTLKTLPYRLKKQTHSL